MSDHSDQCDVIRLDKRVIEITPENVNEYVARHLSGDVYETTAGLKVRLTPDVAAAFHKGGEGVGLCPRPAHSADGGRMSATDCDWEDDIYDDYYAPHECECLDPDYDLISGFAHCFECGRSWSLSSAELESLLRLAVEAQEFYERENLIEYSRLPQYWMIRQFRRVRQMFERMKCCGRRGRHAKDCDGIPF